LRAKLVTIDLCHMNIDDFSFHDSRILEVREISGQVIDFLLNFPIDWENNLFEKRTLRFKGVTSYNIEEIPFVGHPTILDIVTLGSITRDFGNGVNKFQLKATRLEIQTNAGKRIIEFSECEFLF